MTRQADGRLCPSYDGMQLHALLLVYIGNQNLVGISAVTFVAFYRCLGILMTRLRILHENMSSTKLEVITYYNAMSRSEPRPQKQLVKFGCLPVFGF